MNTSLQDLLEQGKFEEAKQMIEGMFASSKKTSEGDVYVDLAAIYLSTMNDINSRYIESLEEAVASLEEVKNHEKQTVSSLKVQEVRAKLNS